MKTKKSPCEIEADEKIAKLVRLMQNNTRIVRSCKVRRLRKPKRASKRPALAGVGTA